ncbi:hypothetical protein Gorai_019786 [Gossypium raimondii]|uniref:RNase H type-1 domain-containing protein n=1 Tax=Gossypium raimondii TaxID=29730 RepID=A0A7J8PP72_GOSRA|nr:hypothetical protein [Gossypium raimondii]
MPIFLRVSSRLVDFNLGCHARLFGREVQLFTDGAIASGNGSASARGVLQDQHGN